MGVATKTRTWNLHRTIFDKIPLRGCFTFQNGNPSGVYVKVGPYICAIPAVEHLNNPHFSFKTVLPRGTGKMNGSWSDFAYYQGVFINVSRAAKVIEVNPSNVLTEANQRDW